MTEKKFRKLVKSLGGTIEDPQCCVEFPDSLRIDTKKEALDLMSVLIHDSYPDNSYSIAIDTPYKALKEFIKKVCA